MHSSHIPNFTNISFYIHIPFCLSKCNYCTFNSYPIKNFENDFIKKYVEEIINQIKSFKNYNFKIESIYFGGGTPSLIDEKFIEKILDNIQKEFSIIENCEITIEVNPETINKSKIKFYKDIGINRISIGIQSFNDKFLKILGRAHNSKQSLFAIETCREIFKNVSFDLIFGLPNQNIYDLEKDLKTIEYYSPTHISYYSLTVEEGSKFFKHGINEVDDTKFSKMYDLIINFLENINLFQYEISNFSKKGFECKHNLRYWDYKEYIGFGAGAVTFFQNKRWQNILSPEKFVKNYNLKEYEENIDANTKEFEYIFLNLRKKAGINLVDFKKKFNSCFLDKYKLIINKLSDFFKIDDENVSLNKEGFKISNLIFSEFLH